MNQDYLNSGKDVIFNNETGEFEYMYSGSIEERLRNFLQSGHKRTYTAEEASSLEDFQNSNKPKFLK